jgi:hypothetical protein
MIVTFANVGFAKTEIDTISNWQVYKDSELLFKSHMLDSHRYSSRIKRNDIYESISLNYFDCVRKNTKKRVALVFGNKVVLEIDGNIDDLVIKIPKIVIDKSIKDYYEKELFVKYFDESNPKGIILGILIFAK